MSPSPLSPAKRERDETEIDHCLRHTVRNLLKADENVTINIVRARVEETLGLPSGFFKNDAGWKTRSKDIVQAAADEPEAPEKPEKTAPEAKAGTKRKSDEAQPQKKRRKKSPTSEAQSDEEEEALSTPKRKARPRKAVASDSELSEPEEEAVSAKHSEPEESALSEPPEYSSEPTTKLDGTQQTANADDESDLSDVVDEPAPAKKQQRTKKSTSPKPKKGASKATAKPAKETSPDEEEIKRLQGWLVKCGIRKVWGKELKKFDTSKQKIKHLKGLLEEAGMTGRYSVEKAKQIKEARELQEEIEAAKEFNEKYGQGEESGGEESGEEVKTRRLKPKGFIDFGDSGDSDSG